jgi:phosphatidylglycerol:prolipoprotein diacylglycerol transferase
MLIHPQINPVALQLGPLGIHWYGLTYLAAFGLFFFLATRRLRHQPFVLHHRPGAWSRKDIEDMLFLGVMGVVVGGRLGYCLFYKPGYYLTHPLEILAVWQGGMSFHGGMLGVLASQWWFARSRQRPWLQVMDFVAPCVPTGLAAGRVGNFINGELWGRFSDPALPWGMVFPGSGSMQPRHPSQVYQFLLEGCCCLCCCGCTRASRARRARFPAPSCWVMACSVSSPSFSVSRTSSSASWPWA